MEPGRARSPLLLFLHLIVGLILSGCSSQAVNNLPPPGPVPFRVEDFVPQASFPVTLAFAPDGRLFYNELSGNVRVVQNGQLLPQPFATLPVDTNGERGLLGLAFDPNFVQNRFVYVYHINPNPLVGRVVRFTEQNNTGTNPVIVLNNMPVGVIHNGGNIGFDRNGRFYLTIGENGNPANSQPPLTNPDGTPNLRGKILRYTIDANGVPTPAGTVSNDPASPIFALGLRNSFDFSFHPTAGTMYASENGPNCDDEVNRIVSQGNYGWRPNYPCGDQTAGFIQPLVPFTPTIAPTGIMFYTGNLFTQWSGHLFLVAFNDGQIRRYVVDENQNGKITASEIIFTDPSGSLLDIVTGPDGNIYFSTQTRIRRIVRGP